MKHISSNLNSRKWQPSSNPFEGLPIRPKLKKERFWIDNEYLEKGYAALLPNPTTLVYNVLAKYANAETQRCFPAYETISKETGIKNRRTVSEALKLLEAFNVIAVVHSKGKYPNQYVLLDAREWKKIDSGTVATVRGAKKTREIVAKETPQPYQTEPVNSGTADTRNHITESDNQIKGSKEEKEKPTKVADGDTSLLNRLSGLTRHVVLDCYTEADVIAALRVVEADEKGHISIKAIDRALHDINAVPFKKPRFPLT